MANSCVVIPLLLHNSCFFVDTRAHAQLYIIRADFYPLVITPQPVFPLT